MPSKASSPEHPLVDGEIAVGARGKPARQLVVADKGGIVLLEGGVAEHMVGMHVGVDHVADRLVGHGADGFAQLAPHHRASQRVDDGDGLVPDDEAGIGHVAAILRRLHLVAALMHEHARRDLRHVKPVSRLDRKAAEQGGGRQRKSRPQEILARYQVALPH